MYRIKSDKYKSARGGSSRILDITCEHCSSHIAYYQKDGPGILKRMYLDRIIDIDSTSAKLSCNSCRRILGIKYTYEKEERPAYRIFVGSIIKKIVKSTVIPSNET